MRKKRGREFPLAQFIAIIVLTISLFLVVDFARRTAATYQIKGEAARLEEEVSAVHARRQALEVRLNYVKSDAYVEEVARTHLKWAREGETVVVVMATPMPVPRPAGEAGSPSTEDFVPRTPWDAWWFIFFDVPPPL